MSLSRVPGVADGGRKIYVDVGSMDVIITPTACPSCGAQNEPGAVNAALNRHQMHADRSPKLWWAMRISHGDVRRRCESCYTEVKLG